MEPKMITIDMHPTRNILYTVASGKLSPDDYDRFIPIAKEKIAQHGNLRWYFEMDRFDGWKDGALWKDLKFDVQHAKDLEKLAVVGEKKMHDWMTQLFKPFTPAEVRYFNMADREEAKRWLENP